MNSKVRLGRKCRRVGEGDVTSIGVTLTSKGGGKHAFAIDVKIHSALYSTVHVDTHKLNPLA